ncbi:MFS transporter [Streptomyces sp. NPDC046887]|uniref:MFS transporter n=1 Tax=Streptomyces sp. NPDC046887 TaxID=3155472 RepID=UPI0033CB7C32
MPGYRSLATRPVLVWCAVSVGARLPVAMAPLALVLMVRERPGGYSLGAVLAAAYVLGEIVGAPVLGTRMRPENARPQLVGGLAGGAAAFLGLGLAQGGHPALLGVLAFLAGAVPAATSGGLRAVLAGMVPPGAVAPAMSLETMLVSGIWAVSPAAATGLALGVVPCAPMLLAGVLMAASVAGLWALPAGWPAEPDGPDADGAPAGASRTRRLARAWPVYVLGAASLSVLALAELILPALLEQRSVAIGWAGPLLAGYAVGMALGAFLYGLRPLPGSPAVQCLAILPVVFALVVAVALLPWLAAVGAALLLAGVCQSVIGLARNLQLRQVLPPSLLAAGFSVNYAFVGAGYAVSGALAGALLHWVAPSTAILAAVGLGLLLTAGGAFGERRLLRPRSLPGLRPDVPRGAGAEGAAVDRRGNAEHGQ